ncbi:MAG: DUF1631 family protein, partial [Gammaproteobacteria bacterium]|nr:DUF1631 family protein [Gammaproteobacteria bacterium]
RAGARLITLGELQRHLQPLLSQTDGVSSAPVREQVHQLLQNENWRLTGEQQRELDVVDQFFTSLRCSSRLAPQTREWLQRLELPVLRSVLRDRAFFEDTNSTLRRVVNRIAQLGVRGTRPNPLVAQRLDALVQRVQADGGENPLLFEEVLAELDDLQARQNLVYRRNVERVMAAAEGAQKVEDARSAVSRELAGRLRGQRVPRALLTLINGGWRDLLILTHIRQGADSAPWRQYMGVLDTLLAWGRDRGTSIDLAELLGTIQEGLASISSNQVPAGHIRDELRRFLVSSVDMADEPVPDSLFDDPQADVRHLSETRHRSLQRWIGRAQKLQVGDWFNLQQEGAEPQPVRLVWIGRDHARFVFVNHQGMKVIEQDLFALASQLQQGLLVPDPAFAQPIVDESVDRMVRQVYDQLAWANAHDPLTGLLNRPELERSLLRQLEAEGTDGNWSLLQLDLRQFRLLNDTAGPAAGDQSLRAVADLLRTQGDESVLAARVGDNAFVLRVPTEDAHAIARQLMQAVAALPLHFAGRDYRLGASVGVAAGSPLLASPGAWLRAVEEACADAKRHGSGQVRSYQAAPAQVQQQDQIAARVASFGNLDDERLLLRCQKIIPLHADTRHGMGHGVLISLYDEDGELIPAQQLVRTAERYNRMQLIDRWVVGQVLDWMRGSPRALERAGQLYVTLSGHSLNDAALLEFIYEALSRQDAPLERLCFEINEASAIHNLDDVVEFMEELRELGCRFCLGHFGAGATAYALLKRLPVDVIKLDGLFARELAESPADQAMVRSMVDMAHFLGREVIASQVEQRAALEVFRNLGVDYAQGYVIEKPRLLDGL